MFEALSTFWNIVRQYEQTIECPRVNYLLIKFI